MRTAHVAVMQKHRCEPANGVIEKLGGVSNVAQLLGKDESTIRRWRMKRPDGTGGSVPDDDKVRLIDIALAIGVTLTWADFAPPTIKGRAA